MADLFSEGAMPVLEQVISFTEARNRVITNNIANADTPEYRVKDLPVAAFRTELSRAVAERSAKSLRYLPVAETDSIGISSTGMLRPQVLELPAEQAGMLRHDGNNVSIDHEMVKLSSNAMLHNMMIQILSKEYAMFNTAISERVT